MKISNSINAWRVTAISVAMALLFATINCNAENFQIKYLNTPTIKINKKLMKTGDWFNENAVIYWEKNTQAMRVLSKQNRMYTISAKAYNASNAKKFSDYLVGKRQLSHRGGISNFYNDLKDIFENKFEILDELQFDLTEVSDLPKGLKFFIYQKGEETPLFTGNPQKGSLTIPRESISSAEGDKETLNLILKIQLPDDSKEYLITEWFQLSPLPLK